MRTDLPTRLLPAAPACRFSTPRPTFAVLAGHIAQRLVNGSGGSRPSDVAPSSEAVPRGAERRGVSWHGSRRMA